MYVEYERLFWTLLLALFCKPRPIRVAWDDGWMAKVRGLIVVADGEGVHERVWLSMYSTWQRRV